MVVFDKDCTLYLDIFIESEDFGDQRIRVNISQCISEIIRLYKLRIVNFNYYDNITLFYKGNVLNPNEFIFNCNIFNNIVLMAKRTGYFNYDRYNFNDNIILNLKIPRKINDLVKYENKFCVKLHKRNLPVNTKSFWKVLLKTQLTDKYEWQRMVSIYERFFINYGKFEYFIGFCSLEMNGNLIGIKKDTVNEIDINFC